MYEKGTVLLQLLMAPTELYSFKQMKKNEFLWQQNKMQPQQNAYPQMRPNPYNYLPGPPGYNYHQGPYVRQDKWH